MLRPYSPGLMLLLCVLMAACTSIPAQTPPQLDDTPGPFVVVEAETLKTATYWVTPPTGWKIVKSSIAADPIAVVFASPDDTMVITLSEETFPIPTQDVTRIIKSDVVTLSNAQKVYVLGHAMSDDEAAFQEIFSTVRDSLRVPRDP